MATPPELSPAQRQAALEKAAEARRHRAAVKEDLRAGTLTLAELFGRAETDEALAKLKVLSLLESLRGVGKVKARRALDELGISASRRVRGLGRHQRQGLLERFEASR